MKQGSCSTLELDERERESVDKKRGRRASTTLDESKKKIFCLINTPTNETCAESEDEQDIRRSRSSVEFDMLTGLVIDVDDDEEDDDDKSTEDKVNNQDGDERIAAGKDDQSICILKGPPSMKRIKSWAGSGWVEVELEGMKACNE